MPPKKKKLSQRPPRTGRKAPPLPAANSEETALFKRCRRGDEAARDELLRRYTGLSVTIARKYHAYFPAMDLSELVAEGSRGVLEALSRYEPRRGVRFSTYAWFWAVKNVQEFITGNIAVIDTPRNIAAELKKITLTMDNDAKRGRRRTLPEIARALDMEVETVRGMLMNKSAVGSVMSLDRSLDDEDQGSSLGDILPDSRDAGLPALAESADQRESLAALLDRLTRQEREVVALRFGLKDQPVSSLKDIARRLKISPAKVRDIEFMARMKLKKMLAADGI